MTLTRESILAAGTKPRIKKMDIPEWGGEICIRGISAGEYDRIQLIQYDAAEGKNRTTVRANWVAALLSDEEGERIFKDEDVIAISKMGAKAIDRVYVAGKAFNEADADELEKN